MKNPLAETLAALNNDPKVHHASGVGEERTLILDMIDEMWYGPQCESRSQPGAVSIGHASMYSDSASATESIAWSNTLNVMLNRLSALRRQMVGTRGSRSSTKRRKMGIGQPHTMTAVTSRICDFAFCRLLIEIEARNASGSGTG